MPPGQEAGDRPAADPAGGLELLVELFRAGVGGEVEGELQRPGPSWRATARLTSRIAGPVRPKWAKRSASRRSRARARRRRGPTRDVGQGQPLQVGDPVGIDPDRDQGRPGRDDRVAEPPGDRVAVARRPAARVGQAADRHDHPTRMDRRVGETDGETLLDGLDAQGRASRNAGSPPTGRARGSGRRARRSHGRRRGRPCRCPRSWSRPLPPRRARRWRSTLSAFNAGPRNLPPAPKACWMLRAPGPGAGRTPGRSAPRRPGGRAGLGRWSGCTGSPPTSGS